MRGWMRGFAVWSFLITACAGPAGHGPASTPGNVGPGAVWPVSPGAVAGVVMQECDTSGDEGIEGCFLRVMEDLGASPEALRFSGSLDSAAFLHAFQEAGLVDLGWVVYPFRANERLGCYLLNGSPGLVDVDDPDRWPMKALTEQTGALNAGRRIRDLSVWPGDRVGPGDLAATALPEGGVRFIAGYVLREGCHACDTVGSAEFAFDFDGEGTFLGTELVSMGRVVHTVVRESVTLSLKAPEEGGVSWQAVRLPASHTLRLESKARIPSHSGRKTLGERWSFRAIQPGRILVAFRRNPSDGPEGLPDSLASFLVVIHEDREALNAHLGGLFAPVVETRLKEMGSPRAGKVDMEVVGVHGDVARVDIRPRTPDTRAWAMVYLRRKHGEWQVSGMAQSFDPDFFADEGIPRELQGPVEIGDPCVPVSVDDCVSVRDAVSKALARPGSMDESVWFRDYAGKEFGEACRITWTGNGEIFSGLEHVSRSIHGVLQELGWTEDPVYAADGPLGTAAGFRKQDALILLRVLMEPSEEAGLLSNQPVSMRELLPEEWVYTITLHCVMQPQGD